MGYIKGQTQFRKSLKGKRLTRDAAILAMCYECNGLEDSNVDCGCSACPLYQWHPHNPNRNNSKRAKKK